MSEDKKSKKFSKAVTEERDSLWEKGLELDGSTLPSLVQREILKDWLLSDSSFKEVCLAHGLSAKEAESLEEKIPKNLLSLKKGARLDSLSLEGREAESESNRQAILSLVLDGFKLARKIQILADLKFRSGDLKPKELSSLVTSWNKILNQVGKFLTQPKIEEAEGFRALMQMTREELGDLRDRIKEYRRYRVEIPEAETILEDEEEREKETQS